MAKKKKVGLITKEQEKQLKKYKNQLKKIENQISDLEEEIQKLDLELAENYEEVSARPNFFDSYKAKKRAYDQLMEAWELAEEKVANFS